MLPAVEVERGVFGLYSFFVIDDTFEPVYGSVFVACGEILGLFLLRFNA